MSTPTSPKYELGTQFAEALPEMAVPTAAEVPAKKAPAKKPAAKANKAAE